MSIINKVKEINWKARIKRLIQLMVIITAADMLLSPQDGLGEIAINIVGTIPTSIYMIVTASLAIWFALNTIDELDGKVRDIPLTLMIASILGTQYFTIQYISQNSILPSNLFGGTINVIFGGVLGLIAWFVGCMIIHGIIISILGIDPKENKNNNTDDPYNDKHAAKILNQEN